MERQARFSGEFTAEADGGGLGSLADELAGAWDDDGYGYEDASSVRDGDASEGGESFGSPRHDASAYESIHDLGIGMGSGMSQGNTDSEHEGLKPPKTRKGGSQRHRRHGSMYDGSDYGNDSDFEDPGDLPPSLEARMAGIDDLVRWNKGDELDADDLLVSRVIDVLRELGGQAGIENSASRLITAHTSLTSHLAHQTRSLQTLTHPLLFSPFPMLSPDAIDDLIPLIDNILPNLPFPVPQNPSDQPPESDPLLSLQALLTQTSDLTHTLRGLSDTLHESRQLTSAASRRLKSVRELVADMRREEEGREEGTRWIEKGEWDKRLEEREAGRECGDVVSGFEAVCGEWRARLFGAGEVAVA